jgi:AraC-like DNA-binding protein
MDTEQLPTRTGPGIVYSQYESRQVAAEQCVAMHGLSYLVAGNLRMVEAGVSQTFGAGSLLFYRKNFLAKFTKLPAENGPFQAITVVFDQAVLRAFSQQHGLSREHPEVARTATLSLGTNRPLQRFYATLQPYFAQPLPEPLARLKQQEALRLLLHTHPALQQVLFDFGQPGKIDLEGFMRQHFRCNIGLLQLAYLTGRSLATFKRDFTRIFQDSPTRWLYRQRLAEAHYLLQEENIRPSDVYQEVGFESLAHFSHAFKQLFGRTPSSVYAAAPACQARASPRLPS